MRSTDLVISTGLRCMGISEMAVQHMATLPTPWQLVGFLLLLKLLFSGRNRTLGVCEILNYTIMYDLQYWKSGGGVRVAYIQNIFIN